MPPAPIERPRWLADPRVRRHRLPTGDLWIGDAEPDPTHSVHALCGFSARRNPRRGFLFVSTILGRYLPVRPRALDEPVTGLAARLPADLPGPILFVGVAAAGLSIGHRLWARYVERTGRDDTLHVASTRHRFDAPLAYAFDEPHSHAPRHRIHRPLDPDDAALFERARTVVIVDDEVTSGRTVSELIAAHHSHCPRARRFVHAVLTDWTPGPLCERAPSGCTIDVVALARGRHHFERDPDFAVDMPDVTGDSRPRWHAATPGHARFGRRTPLTLRAMPALELPAVDAGARVLVLGLGEAQYPALLLAEHLVDRGADACFQYTVRAPVLPSGPIERVTTLVDPHGEDMPNFLYNVAPGRFDRVLVCRQAPAAPPTDLLAALGAELVEIGPMIR